MYVEIAGARMQIKVLEFETNLSDDERSIAMLTDGTIEGSVTLTINNSYYRVMALSRMLEKHSPKKAKTIKNRFEHLNPLRSLGLL